MTENGAINNLELNRPFAYSELQESIDIAIDALKKQIPKKPIFTEDKQFALCPSCDGKGLFDKQKHCDNCGQAIDWSDAD